LPIPRASRRCHTGRREQLFLHGSSVVAWSPVLILRLHYPTVSIHQSNEAWKCNYFAADFPTPTTPSPPPPQTCWLELFKQRYASVWNVLMRPGGCIYHHFFGVVSIEM
jgi:hypothetical protein